MLPAPFHVLSASIILFSDCFNELRCLNAIRWYLHTFEFSIRFETVLFVFLTAVYVFAIWSAVNEGPSGWNLTEDWSCVTVFLIFVVWTGRDQLASGLCHPNHLLGRARRNMAKAPSWNVLAPEWKEDWRTCLLPGAHVSWFRTRLMEYSNNWLLFCSLR